MLTQHRLLVPAVDVEAFNAYLQGKRPGEHATNDHGHVMEFSHTFDNGVMVCVGVTAMCTLTFKLFDNTGHLQVKQVPNRDDIADPLNVEQQYSAWYGHQHYTLLVHRRANDTLTTEAAAAYSVSPTACPFCRSTEIHQGPFEPTDDITLVVSRVACCTCQADWLTRYALDGVDTTPGCWTPPKAIVPQADVTDDDEYDDDEDDDIDDEDDDEDED